VAYAPDVTRLLLAWREGDDAALERLIPLATASCARPPTPECWSEHPGLTLSVKETAEVLAVSPQIVMREWKMARLCLFKALRHREVSDAG
jgi:hypothetical protein